MTDYSTFTGLEAYTPSLKDNIKGSLITFGLRIKKAIGKATAKKPRVMETAQYLKLINFMDVFYWQQSVRKSNIKNIKGVGQ